MRDEKKGYRQGKKVRDPELLTRNFSALVPVARSPEKRCPERKKDKEIDKHGIYQMNGKIDKVIPGDIEPVKFVVQGKGEIPYVPRLEAVIDRQTLCLRGVRKIAQVSDNRIPDYVIRLVPLKRVMKGVRICQKTENCDDQEVDNRLGKEILLVRRELMSFFVFLDESSRLLFP